MQISYASVIKRTLSALLASVALLYCSASFSLSTITAGDICDVKNPSAKDIRRDHGGIINIRPTGNFNVACPISTFYGASEYNVSIVFENFHQDGITQTYRCTLTEYDVANFKIRSYNRSVRIDSGFAAVLLFEEVQLDEDLNRLHVICNLPPHCIIGHVAVDNL